MPFIIIAITGCDAAWNLANRGSLRSDVTELFKNHGVTVSDLKCNMIGTTRSAVCEFRGKTDQVTSLVRGLKLKALEGGETSREALLRRIPEAPQGCLACFPFQTASQMKIYMSERGAKELRLKSGGAFEYLILFQDLGSSRVCVQVSYAYG